jgi:hypothetical protein
MRGGRGAPDRRHLLGSSQSVPEAIMRLRIDISSKGIEEIRGACLVLWTRDADGG